MAINTDHVTDTFTASSGTLATPGSFGAAGATLSDPGSGPRLSDAQGNYFRLTGSVGGGVEVTGPLSFTSANRQFQYIVSGAGKIATLPDNAGGLIGTGDVGTVTSTMILDGTILNGDVNASAAIDGTKINPNFGAQLIQSSQANQALSLTGSLNPSSTTNGLLSVGTLGFSGSRMGGNFASSQTSFYQVILQNTNNGANASTDFVVCNDASTDTAIYGNFGINSSTFSGTSSLNLPSATYLTATTGDLALGTTSANNIRVVYNSENTDAILVAASDITLGKTLKLRAGTATAGTAPLDFTAGTNLTVAEAGAFEYDGTYFYATPTTTSGRGQTGVFQTFRLAANGTAIGPAIADFFGATSAINLAAASVYEINFFAYLQKNTAGTLTWTLTASSAPTLITAIHRAGPITGIAAGAPTTLYTGSRGATTAAFGATGSITNNAFMAYEFQARVITNLATTFKLQVTSSAGTVTPQAGSFYTVRQVSGTVGSFA